MSLLQRFRELRRSGLSRSAALAALDTTAETVAVHEQDPDRPEYATPGLSRAYDGGMYLVVSSVGGFILGDTDAFDGGSYNSVQWYQAGGGDGSQHFNIQLGPKNSPISWDFGPDGAFWMPGNSKLYNTASVPDDAVGQEGSWALSHDGHLYFKTGGAWVQKV